MTRTILITGCSSGIGLDAARSMAARGWRVFATCRKAEDCARLQAEGLESFVLDHDDPESITAAIAQAMERAGRIDAAFLNGAFALPAMAEDVPRDGMRAVMETNFIGVHDIARQLVPIMRDQGHGRLLFCSSVLGLVGIKYRAPYVASKFAMEGYADCLRMELHGSGIDVSLIEPGPIPTRIRQNAQKNFERWIAWETSRHRPFYERSLRPRLYDESGTPDRFERPVSAVTQTVIHACESPRPKARYFITPGTYLGNLVRRFLPTRAADAILRRN
ncbi:NAD(P)-dependent dehydrogenase (short-subunit alcohol dehydrogenase family) [Rubricella aquisinus]|uniref:NAD(P)-dependent dehydrogenase (Short-subunit alcohol dehydrogenase family) n=1 Tax=Rubricella aquisinus TaxID=2028108 RepID=A0A840WNU0_9RHOB|nr:SDR family NAD(P)-dependent oxidoreductase [Rubricella aquisinus]MBB5515322.1 NAD(P)-dependent dehydrogenase (short-subunit alcohol dehydrogenase family) [Rubricella aquisinus]